MRHINLAAAMLAAALMPAGAQEAPATIPITFFGEARTRSEWDHPVGATPTDAFTYLRSRFGARIDAAPGARIVLQLQDSRVLGAEASSAPAATAADVFDVHQGYLELSGSLGGATSTVRAGRQEIALGNERLVGPVGWSNTGRSFDGVRWLVSRKNAAGGDQWLASAMAAIIEERGRHFGATTSPSTDHSVGALYARRVWSLATLDATLLYDGGASYRSYTNANRTTVDARLLAPHIADVVRLEIEGAYQSGSQRYVTSTGTETRQAVGAWLAGARLGTATIDGRRTTATVGVDVLSGDATPTDGRYSAFSTMFATNHPFYGLMDLIGDPATTTKDRGLVDAFASGSRVLSSKLALKGEVHDFTLAKGTDRSLGWEGDVALPLRVNSAATVELGYSAFRAAAGAKAIGLGTQKATAQWAYLQLTVGF